MRRLVTPMSYVLLPALALTCLGLSFAEESPPVGLQLEAEAVSADKAAGLANQVRTRIQQPARAGSLAEIAMIQQVPERRPAEAVEPEEEVRQSAAAPEGERAAPEQRLRQRQSKRIRSRDRARAVQEDLLQKAKPAGKDRDLSRRLLDDASELSSAKGKAARTGRESGLAAGASERLHAPPGQGPGAAGVPGQGPGPKAGESLKGRQGPLDPGQRGPLQPPGDRFRPAGPGAGSSGPRR